MTNEELKAKAESIEEGPNGERYYILPVGSLTSDEFAELIMDGVKRLQSQRTPSLSGSVEIQ